MTTTTTIKKILILCIIIIFSYVLFRFIQKHRANLAIQKAVLNQREKEGFQEGLTTDENKKDIQTMTLKDSGPGVTAFNISKNPNVLLKDLIVKSSYNTAYTGSKMSMSAITYALTRGYRFIDFEVYMVDDLPVIGFSSDSTSNIISSSNTLPLGQVFYNIIVSAFSAPTPNSTDPLFIQLRIKSKDNAIYEMIAKSVDANIKNRLYKEKVDGYTHFKDIMKKIVLIIDKKTAPSYKDYPNCSEFVETETKKNCYNLTDYINIESNGDYLQVHKYNDLLDQQTNPPHVNDDETTDTTVLKLSYPDGILNTGNPEMMGLCKGYGVQFVAVRLYIVDSNLKAYEKTFNTIGNAIVPFSKYLSQQPTTK
jgi:hypothetical protein